MRDPIQLDIEDYLARLDGRGEAGEPVAVGGAYLSHAAYLAEAYGRMEDYGDEPEGLWDGFGEAHPDDVEPAEELAAEQAADFPPEFDELVERVAFGGPIMAGLIAAVRAGLDPVAVARAAVARAC